MSTWKAHAASGLTVSDDGRARRSANGVSVPVHVINNGKGRAVCGNGRTFTLASVMLEAHVGRPSAKAHACLIDGNPENMKLDNLEWRNEGESESKKRAKTRAEHEIRVKLTGALADEIRTAAGITGTSCVAIVRRAVERYLIGGLE